MARIIRFSMGLLAVSLLTFLGLNATTGQEATPPPFYDFPEGFDTDALGSTPNIRLPAGTPFRASVVRYTYEPGVSFELQYHGPVLFVVERGSLAVTGSDERRLVFMETFEEGDPSPPPLGVKEGVEFILQRGQSVFAEDGRLGPTRNAGDETLVVLVLMIVVDPGGMTWDVTGDPNATPMNEIEAPLP